MFRHEYNTCCCRSHFNWFYMFTVFILGYATYVGVEEAYRLSKRKDPQDYMNEVDPNPDPCKEKREKREREKQAKK